MTFLFLEICCIWLIVQNNKYQGAKYFNSSNRFAANLLQTSTGVSDYFNLKNVNGDLAEENAVLRKELQQLKQSLYDIETLETKDFEIINKYDFISAKVIKNSTRNVDNFLTVDKGSLENVEPGMGVIGSHGVIGSVKSVSRHFAVITSLLHSDMLLSSKISRTGDLCTTSWNTIDPLMGNLEFVPLHIELQVGDSIVTSSNNAIFPEGIFIGKISKFNKTEGAAYYNVDVELATDFNAISYVYLVKNNLKPQLDSLHSEIGGLNE